jgi:predicted ribosomally synthesized peptide with SipW-like signal peptide
MKKILMRVAVIGFVGAVAAGATGAFFSDTETSTGNTFTAGAIDLKVDSTQHYNGSVCALGVHGDDSNTWSWNLDGTGGYPVKGTSCDGSWTEADLGAQTFFHFGDIKPGDLGENTISLHVINNDAWLKMGIGDIADLENLCNEPETTVPDNTCGTGLTDGELGTDMMFRAWVDNGVTDTQGVVTGKGDNIWQQGEVFIGSQTDGWMTLSNLKAAFTALSAWSVTGGDTFYVGMEWKLDGTEGNITQTDSLGFPVMFQVVQKRNNTVSPYGLTI